MSDDLPDADELAKFVEEQTIKESNMSLNNYSNMETEETKYDGENQDPMAGHGPKTILDREDLYHQGRLRRRELSPERRDAF